MQKTLADVQSRHTDERHTDLSAVFPSVYESET